MALEPSAEITLLRRGELVVPNQEGQVDVQRAPAGQILNPNGRMHLAFGNRSGRSSCIVYPDHMGNGLSIARGPLSVDLAVNPKDGSYRRVIPVDVTTFATLPQWGVERQVRPINGDAMVDVRFLGHPERNGPLGQAFEQQQQQFQPDLLLPHENKRKGDNSWVVHTTPPFKATFYGLDGAKGQGVRWQDDPKDGYPAQAMFALGFSNEVTASEDTYMQLSLISRSDQDQLIRIYQGGWQHVGFWFDHPAWLRRMAALATFTDLVAQKANDQSEVLDSVALHLVPGLTNFAKGLNRREHARYYDSYTPRSQVKFVGPELEGLQRYYGLDWNRWLAELKYSHREDYYDRLNQLTDKFQQVSVQTLGGRSVVKPLPEHHKYDNWYPKLEV